MGGYKLKIKTIASIVTVLSVGLFFVGVVSATPSPNGPGQPGAPVVACGSPGATEQPPGFLTLGFAHAAEVYAGSPGTPSLANANSPHAISQYDIACFQVTQNKP